MKAIILLIMLTSTFSYSSLLSAKTLGVYGATFPIIEPDLLKVIQEKLAQFKKTGRLEQLERQVSQTAKARLNTPKPVMGIEKATVNTRRVFDPSIVLSRDIKTPQGQYIAHAGDVINPLEKVSLRKALIFIDGDDVAQMQWAMRMYQKQTTKPDIILINGHILDLMQQYHIKLYFDQRGLLTKRFGISKVPSMITQEDKHLVIQEVRV